MRFSGSEQMNQQSNQQKDKNSLCKNKQDEFWPGFCSGWSGTGHDRRQRIQADIQENENKV